MIQKVGDERIVVELAGIDDPARAKAIVQRSAFLEFRITDETSALEKAMPAMDRALREPGDHAAQTPAGRPSAVEQLLGGDTAQEGRRGQRRQGSPARRAAKDSARGQRGQGARRDTAGAGDGVLTGLIQVSGAAGGGSPGRVHGARDRVSPGGQPAQHPGGGAAAPARHRAALVGRSRPASACESYRFLYALDDRPIITGSNLEDAQAQIDPLTNGPIVTFQLDRAGGRKFGEETGRHVGDYMAILLDGRVQGRPPVIQSRIGRNGQITLGGRTLQEAQDLALTLKAGALPIPLKIVEERQVGPASARTPSGRASSPASSARSSS